LSSYDVLHCFPPRRSADLENDVNLAALAESTSGEGEGLDSFALLMLDDGLGAGFIINGALHRGASGIAGEVQFLPQSPLPIAAPDRKSTRLNSSHVKISYA